MQLDGTESKVRLNNTHFFNLCSVYLSLKLFYLARAGMFTMCKCLLQLVMYMPDKQATASFRNMRKKRLVLMHNFSKYCRMNSFFGVELSNVQNMIRALNDSDCLVLY